LSFSFIRSHANRQSPQQKRQKGLKPQGIYYGWVMAVALGITELTSWGILYYAISVFFAPMERELGWTRAESSGAFSFGLLLSGVVAVPIGRWLDRHGARLVMTLGSVAGVLLLLLWSRVDDLTSFYIIWGGLGLALSATLYEPAFAVITAWFKQHRTGAMAIVTFFGGLASTVFLPLTNWLVEMQGWRGALVSLAVILGVITIPVHALLLRNRPPRAEQLSKDSPRPALAAGSESFRGLLQQPSFRWLLLATCLTQTATVGAAVHLVPYLLESGYQAALAATLAGLVGVMQIAGRLIYAPFGDRVPVLRSAAAIQLLEPIGMLLLLLVPGVPGVLVFVALFGAGRGAATLTRPAVVVHLYGSAQFGSINGLLALVSALSRAAGPIAVAAAHDALGSYDPAILGLALMSAVGAAALFRMRD
jgi:predicted MFS family arabinose efflux permease